MLNAVEADSGDNPAAKGDLADGALDAPSPQEARL